MNDESNPFSYINEGNARRLAHLFILRNSEPALIATVASYLSPGCVERLIGALLQPLT